MFEGHNFHNLKICFLNILNNSSKFYKFLIFQKFPFCLSEISVLFVGIIFYHIFRRGCNFTYSLHTYSEFGKYSISIERFMVRVIKTSSAELDPVHFSAVVFLWHYSHLNIICRIRSCSFFCCCFCVTLFSHVLVFGSSCQWPIHACNL